MRILLLVSLGVLALLVGAGCGGDDDDGAPNNTPTASASAEPTGSPATVEPAGSPPGNCIVLDSVASAGDLTWSDVQPPDAPDLGEYSVGDIEGDAPLVGVLLEGEVVGTVELLQFPTTGNVDVSRPTVEGLSEWAERFYDDVAPEREAAGGTLVGDEPIEASLGTACGVRYGYSVTDEDDAVIERYVGYATHDGDKMFLFVALYDAAIAEEQGFQTFGALEGFELELAEFIGALDFPPG